jgi:hypothetical protein
MPPVNSFLTPWSNFYVVIGSAAASLTGLMFVVITLLTRTNPPGTRDGISNFSTPTVVHFGAALLISAMLVVPWHTLTYPCVLLGLAGFWGAVYVARLIGRSWRMTGEYVPDIEDWLSYSFLPLIAYIVMIVAAIGLSFFPATALFVLAGCAVLLVFIGIHNAWDIVTYLTILLRNEPPQ